MIGEGHPEDGPMRFEDKPRWLLSYIADKDLLIDMRRWVAQLPKDATELQRDHKLVTIPSHCILAARALGRALQILDRRPEGDQAADLTGDRNSFIREFCAAYLAAACLRDGRAATQREVALAYEDAEKAWEAFEKVRFRLF